MPNGLHSGNSADANRAEGMAALPAAWKHDQAHCQDKQEYVEEAKKQLDFHASNEGVTAAPRSFSDDPEDLPNSQRASKAEASLSDDHDLVGRQESDNPQPVLAEGRATVLHAGVNKEQTQLEVASTIETAETLHKVVHAQKYLWLAGKFLWCCEWLQDNLLFTKKSESSFQNGREISS